MPLSQSAYYRDAEKEEATRNAQINLIIKSVAGMVYV